MPATPAGTTPGSATVGGVFLATRQVARLIEWYREVGLPVGDDGTCRLGGAAGDSSAGAFVFSIMEAKGELPGVAGDVDEEPYGRQRAMLNLRVPDLDATLADLRKRGSDLAGPRDYGYGRFAWVKDPDGNLVEIWQAGITPP